MDNNQLNLSRESAINFNCIDVVDFQTNNMFVVTHLGQLKQMESLIRLKELQKNTLIVLYTQKNYKVPQSVHDSFSDLFDKVIFLEIPFGLNQYNYFLYRNIERKYLSLIQNIQPLNIFLNSFEYHYSLLCALSKKFGIPLALVEEGTATYKLLSNESKSVTYSMVLDDLKKNLINTIGQTQHVKKVVRFSKSYRELSFFDFFIKDYLLNPDLTKYNKQFYKSVKRFYAKAPGNEALHKALISELGSEQLKLSLLPNLSFNIAYVSHPELIKKKFNIDSVEFFFAHALNDVDSVAYAKSIIKKYDISASDVLYVSQRYFIDPIAYLHFFEQCIVPIANPGQKIFIKLHPKEGEDTLSIFRKYALNSNGNIVLIEESQFLIETVIRVVGFESVVGLTSTVLMYTPLISPQTKVISVANLLVRFFEQSNENIKNDIVLNIKNHAAILENFKKVKLI